MRILLFLLAIFALTAGIGSRAQAQRRIADGAVRLDGAPARKNDRLRGGELFFWVMRRAPGNDGKCPRC